MYKVKQQKKEQPKVRICGKKQIRNPNPNPEPEPELPPRKTIFDSRGSNNVDSITAYTDVLRMNEPGFPKDSIPIYFAGHWIEIMKDASRELILKDVFDCETASYEISNDEKFLYFDCITGRIVDTFENFGCLFLYKESYDETLNYTYLVKCDDSEQEGSIKYGKQVIYVYCNGFEEIDTEDGTKYVPIKPRKIRALNTDISNVTFYFYTIGDSEKQDVSKEITILREPYHFVPGTSEEEKELGIGELVEGEPGTTPEPGPGPEPEPEDPFAPVDSEGNIIVDPESGEPIQRVINQDTINDEDLEHCTVIIDGEEVEVDLRGSFPVHKFKEDGSLDKIEDKLVVDHYVFVYYQIERLLKGDENIKINFYIGNHQSVNKEDEALMLNRRIELHTAEDSELRLINKEVEVEHYPCNVLYYASEGNEKVTINEYKIMEYQGLFVDCLVQSNVEYVNGDLHVYEEGKLSCYEPVDKKLTRFRPIDLVVSKTGSIIYPQGGLLCSDVIQEDIESEQ